MTEAKKLDLGVEVADMHYGHHALSPHYRISNKTTWTASGHACNAFIKFIEASVGERYFYTNKLLVIISYDTDFDGWWTAAWCYDGHRCGVLKIKPRDDDAEAS